MPLTATTLGRLLLAADYGQPTHADLWHLLAWTGLRIGEALHLDVQPLTPPGLAQLGKHSREDLRQVRHVADRIVDLAFRQRAPRPVGKACPLVDRDAQPAFDQV